MILRMIPATILFCGTTLVSNFGANADQNVTVATLDWPPYTGSDLPKSGATSEVVRQAFNAVGVSTEIDILPWKRAIAAAQSDIEVVAYYPGYHCRHVDGFVASAPIGQGPLGLAEHVENPVEWESLDDLGDQKLKIGTVLGYANTDEFDKKAGTGWIRALPAPDDLTNLKKLEKRRIDAAVIDKLVLAYLLATESDLAANAASIVFNAKPIEEKTLYLCFNDDEAGRNLKDLFNEGLAQIDVGQIVDSYFQNEF